MSQNDDASSSKKIPQIQDFDGFLAVALENLHHGQLWDCPFYHSQCSSRQRASSPNPFTCFRGFLLSKTLLRGLQLEQAPPHFLTLPWACHVPAPTLMFARLCENKARESSDGIKPLNVIELAPNGLLELQAWLGPSLGGRKHARTKEGWKRTSLWDMTLGYVAVQSVFFTFFLRGTH